MLCSGGSSSACARARAPGGSGGAAAAGSILPCGLKSGCGGTTAESGDSRLFECAPGSRGCMADWMPGCMPEGRGTPGVGIPNGVFPCVGVDGPKPGEVRGAVALWGKRNDEPPALGTWPPAPLSVRRGVPT